MFRYNNFGGFVGLPLNFISVIWYLISVVQMFMAYGTAYRKTRAGGDNGAALFGWLFVYNLAAIIPGLGIYLWNKSRRY